MSDVSLRVKSVSIYWQDDEMQIKTEEGATHTIVLDTPISVIMTGFGREDEEKELTAGKLGWYIERGYIIRQITFEDEEDK